MELNFNPFPQLETGRLILRKVETSDDAAIFRLRSDPRVMKHIGRPLATSIEDARTLIRRFIDDIENNAGITWAITMKNDPVLIGTIGFWKVLPEHSRAEIGYLLDCEFQGKGIMDEALKLVTEYGFNTMKLHSIEADTSPANLASRKLLEKNKFVQEGYFKENFYFNGQYLDTVVYSILDGKAL